MAQSAKPIRHLLSLPPAIARQFARLEDRHLPEWFASSDPAGRKLGSGGGTAHLLADAWRESNEGRSFEDWLGDAQSLLIHGGGQSRRLPAYAPVGKLLMPLPAFRWALGHRLDQTLLDLQVPEYRRVIAHGGEGYAAMVTSGDVLLRFGRDLPQFPGVDVLGLGMWVTPERAKDFGVFFCHRQSPSQLAFFLQKPSATRIRELSSDYLCLIDTGMWLLSARAVRVLMEKSGWLVNKQAFADGIPRHYELYSQFGLGLGAAPQFADSEINALTSAVVPLPKAEFYHLGTSRQMIEAVSALQNIELDETKLGSMGSKRHPDQFLQNCKVEVPLRREENHTLWIENSNIPATWHLSHDHVLTGIPPNSWKLQLEPGVCLDFIPIGDSNFCIRPYGMNDLFSGPASDANTRWLGRPAPNWFFGRSISREEIGIDTTTDIQSAPIFPVLTLDQIDGAFLEWLVSAKPSHNSEFSNLWLKVRRLSANEIGTEANLGRLYRSREELRKLCLLPMLRNYRWSVFFKLDLEATAKLFASTDFALSDEENDLDEALEPMLLVRSEMFRAAVLRDRRQAGWEKHEEKAFAQLRDIIVRESQVSPVEPRCNILEDQIVWGRSPVRLDIAGGWTDTPPYCLEHGGSVLNLAADLNGQPPIQVFAKRSVRPEFVLRSIDLGTEERVRTYEELDQFATPGSEFALAKASLALAGFLPRFNARGGFKTLREQLLEFGGGLELSMLSAVPKGSGLGTSSILAATMLGTLGEVCDLKWDRNVLFKRTLAVEQLLTTGGGWQDQAGGLFRGIKLLETNAGFEQKPTLRWCPEHMFDADHANKSILLYYTGVTRLAKDILHEIVRGIFLNSTDHLRIVDEIGQNARFAFNAIQTSEYEGLVEAVRRSWDLNQRLDSGTNPESVQAIIARVQDYLAATKLLGAGGGGYLLLFAKDEAAATRIRKELSARPPNERARFVNLSLSETGLQLTRS